MIFETYIEDWKFYEDIWKEYRVKVTHEAEFNTIGFDIGQKGLPMPWWNKLKDDFKKASGVDFKKIIQTWGIEYFDGGYQTLHKHNDDTINSILFFDDQPRTSKASTLNGLLYTIYDNEYKTIHPEPGKLVLFSSDVWHGVYPAKAPRRSFMVDFER